MNTPSFGLVSSTIHVYPADHIDASGRWLFWSAPPSAALLRSMELHGQLCPVLVDASGQHPVLVAGAARLACLRLLERDVRCLDLGGLGEWDRALAYIASNSTSEVDDGRVIMALRFFQDKDKTRLEEVLAPLGLDLRSKRARLALAWLDLPDRWDGLLSAGHVPLACAELLRGFSAEDLTCLFPFFADLSWSRGSAVNVLTWIRELVLKDACATADVLDRAGVRGILGAGLSPKDTIARITAEIRRVRFPGLTRLERDFGDAARGIVAGTGWRLAQPDQFETGFVDMSIRLSCRADVTRAAHDLGVMVSSADWDRLFAEGDQ